MDPHLYEGKVLNIENVDQWVPPYSKWERKGKICCFNIAYFPAIKKYFINQWECNCFFPSIVLFLFIVSFGAGMWAIPEIFNNTTKIVMWVLFSLSFLLFLLSYVFSMCRSPGYLPFYWAVERRHSYTYEEQMDGIITNEDQFNFANCNDRPERGSLSSQGRRLILRADHVCKWISNWVGLKNYRYFYMQLFWTFVVFVFYWVICGYEIAKIVHDKSVTPCQILLMVLFLPDGGFFIFFCQVFLRHSKYLFHNETTLGELKRSQNTDKHNYYDLGCCRNIEQTMGPCQYCPLYLCPVPIPRSEHDGFNWELNRPFPNPPEVFPPVTEEMVRNALTKEEYLARTETENNTPAPQASEPPKPESHKSDKKKHKHDGETKEERKARKERHRQKKLAKADQEDPEQGPAIV